MHCIKTGISIFIASTGEHTYVDLFSNGFDLYVNKNTKFKRNVREVECEVIALEDHGKYDKLIDPSFDQSVIEYVKSMRFKTAYEDKFIESFEKSE